MYKFKNSLIAFAGLAALAVVTPLLMPLIGLGSNATGLNAPTSQTQNVNVVNTPTVSAQQNGTWNVGINGTPTVNVSPNETVLAYDQTRTLGALDFAILPPLDVSGFKDIRVVATVNGSVDYDLLLRVVNPQNQPVVIDNINQAHPGSGTKTYNIICQTVDFYLSSGGVTAVHIQVYGRSN